MTAKKFGYVRVSSKEQNEGRQIENMKKEGIQTERDIFIDKQSGKNFDRPDYQALKKVVRAGDTVVFDSITRMGRNMKETQKEYEWFVDNGVQLRFIKEPMLNTNGGVDDVMKQAIQKIILTILTAFAEKERQDIKQRQKEGIDLAKAQGKHIGRPKVEVTPEFKEVYKRWKSGELMAVQAMKELDLSKTVFYKLVKRHEGRE